MFFLDPSEEEVSFGVIGNNTSLIAEFGSTTDNAYFTIYGNNTSNIGYAIGSSNINPTTPIFSIGQWTDNVSSNDFVINNHNIGIGNYSPNYKLDVNGTSHFTQTLIADSDINIGGLASMSALVIRDDGITTPFTNTNTNPSSIQTQFLNTGDTVNFINFSGEILINDITNGYIYKFIVGGENLYLLGSTNPNWSPSLVGASQSFTLSGWITMTYTNDGYYQFTNNTIASSYTFYTIQTNIVC